MFQPEECAHCTFTSTIVLGILMLWQTETFLHLHSCMYRWILQICHLDGSMVYNPKIIAGYFLEAVKHASGCPKSVVGCRYWVNYVEFSSKLCWIFKIIEFSSHLWWIFKICWIFKLIMINCLNNMLKFQVNYV